MGAVLLGAAVQSPPPGDMQRHGQSKGLTTALIANVSLATNEQLTMSRALPLPSELAASLSD